MCNELNWTGLNWTVRFKLISDTQLIQLELFGTIFSQLVYLLVWGWISTFLSQQTALCLWDKHVICCRQAEFHQWSVKQKSEEKEASVPELLTPAAPWAERLAVFLGEAGTPFRTTRSVKKKTQLSPEWLLSTFPDFRLIPRENNLAPWNICACSSERWQRHVEETFGRHLKYLAQSSVEVCFRIFLKKEDSFQKVR